MSGDLQALALLVFPFTFLVPFLRSMWPLMFGEGDSLERPCIYCGAKRDDHEPSGCCGDGGGSTFEGAAA